MRFFSIPKRPDRLWGQPSFLFSECVRGIYQGVKRPKRDADHAPPSSAEVKNDWSYISTLPYVFMACRGTNLPFAGRVAFK